MAQNSKFRVSPFRRNNLVVKVVVVSKEGETKTSVELESREQFEGYINFLHREGRIDDQTFAEMLEFNSNLEWDPTTEKDHQLVRDFIVEYEYSLDIRDEAIDWLTNREVRRLSGENLYFAAALALVIAVESITNVAQSISDSDVIDEILEWAWRESRADDDNPYCYVEETFCEAVRYAACHVVGRPSKGPDGKAKSEQSGESA